MSLIYGYNKKKDTSSSGSSSNSGELEKIVQKNKKDIQEKATLLGSKTDPSTADTAFGKIQKNEAAINIRSIFSSIAFGRIQTSETNIQTNTNLLGSKTDDKTVDSVFGKIQKTTSFVGDASSLEGEPTLKGTQLSHASAIAAHAGNLLVLEDAVGVKTDVGTVDTAFGRIKKNKEDIQNLKQSVELKESSGTFVAPLNDGKVEITGWTIPRQSTIISIIIKAEQNLSGVSRATLYSGTSLSNNSHTMTVPMSLANMKLGRPAVITHTKDPGHAKMYANTRGNAVGSVAERTISVRFVYIDHSGSV